MTETWPDGERYLHHERVVFEAVDDWPCVVLSQFDVSVRLVFTPARRGRTFSWDSESSTRRVDQLGHGCCSLLHNVSVEDNSGGAVAPCDAPRGPSERRMPQAGSIVGNATQGQLVAHSGALRAKTARSQL